MSKETGLKITAKLGRVFDIILVEVGGDIILVEVGGKEGRHIKLLVELDITKPLQRGTKPQFRKQENWVDFRYEQLPDLCFYCGLISHNEKGCCKRKLDVAVNCLMVSQYGMWMKAGTLRVVNIEKEAMQAKLDRLIAIDNQARDKGKDATNQVRQPVEQETEEKGTTMPVGDKRGKELMLVGNKGNKEILGSGRIQKKIQGEQTRSNMR